MAAAATQLAPGSRLGNYRIVEYLARGGMADIYIGHRADAVNAPAVAIKRLRPCYRGHPEYVQMLVDEANLMARLRHPNIVRVRDTSEVASAGFFTMELVRGQTLLNTLIGALDWQGQLPLEQAVTIVLRAAAGLDYAHNATTASGRPLEVVHRDVSPANVLVGYDGSVKVADFGVAKATRRFTETGARVIKGKIGYMSPEQALGQPIDRRSDVFALGILLYESTTGTRLFTGDSDYEVLSTIVNEPAPRPSFVSTFYPGNLEEVVMRAVERHPERRYSSVREFIIALERVAGDLRMTTNRDTLAAFMAELRRQDDASDDPLVVYDSPDTDVMPAPPSFCPASRARSARRVRAVRGLARGTPAPAAPLGNLFEDLVSVGATRTAQSPLSAGEFFVAPAARRRATVEEGTGSAVSPRILFREE